LDLTFYYVIVCRLSPQTSTGLQSSGQTTTRAAPVCRLMVSTPVIYVITWISTRLPTPRGWKAELALLVYSWRTPYPRIGHM